MEFGSMGVEAGVAAGNVALVIYGLLCVPRAFAIAVARPGPNKMAALEIGMLALMCALMTAIALAGYYASARLIAPWLWASWLALTLMRIIEFLPMILISIAWWRLLGRARRSLILSGCLEVTLAFSIFFIVLWRLW